MNITGATAVPNDWTEGDPVPVVPAGQQPTVPYNNTWFSAEYRVKGTAVQCRIYGGYLENTDVIFDFGLHRSFGQARYVRTKNAIYGALDMTVHVDILLRYLTS